MFPLFFPEQPYINTCRLVGEEYLLEQATLVSQEGGSYVSPEPDFVFPYITKSDFTTVCRYKLLGQINNGLHLYVNNFSFKFGFLHCISFIGGGEGGCNCRMVLLYHYLYVGFYDLYF